MDDLDTPIKISNREFQRLLILDQALRKLKQYGAKRYSSYTVVVDHEAFTEAINAYDRWTDTRMTVTDGSTQCR